MEYIKLENLKDGYLYRVDARNASYGIYRESTGGFVISRWKFGLNYTFEEYYEDGRPYGTVRPLKEVEKSPFKPDEDAIMVEKVHSDGKKFWSSPKEEGILKYLNGQPIPETADDSTTYCKGCKVEYITSAIYPSGLCRICDEKRQKGGGK